MISGKTDADDARHVIAISGPVGAGKSTLVKALSARLPGASAIYFDHYEKITEQPIEKIARWMQTGADLDELVIPSLAEDLEALKAGRPAVDPLTNSETSANKYILFESQFGRRHAATGRYIDFLIWIETPLDLALARKVRQFAGELRDARDRRQIDQFAPWLHAYLGNYLSVVGGLLRIQRDSVGANADLVLDGEREPEELLLRAEQEILGRFG